MSSPKNSASMNNQAFELLKAFIRVIGITFFLSTIGLLTYLPDQFAYWSRGGPVAQTIVITTLSLLFRAGLNLVFALILWFGAGPLARFAGKGLSRESSSSVASTPVA
jgi:hypothetical protein